MPVTYQFQKNGGNPRVFHATGSLHPGIPQACLEKMVGFLEALHQSANVQRRFAVAGGPWEFNLRDLLRWCHLAQGAADRSAPACRGCICICMAGPRRCNLHMLAALL